MAKAEDQLMAQLAKVVKLERALTQAENQIISLKKTLLVIQEETESYEKDIHVDFKVGTFQYTPSPARQSSGRLPDHSPATNVNLLSSQVEELNQSKQAINSLSLALEIREKELKTSLAKEQELVDELKKVSFERDESELQLNQKLAYLEHLERFLHEAVAIRDESHQQYHKIHLENMRLVDEINTYKKCPSWPVLSFEYQEILATSASGILHPMNDAEAQNGDEHLGKRNIIEHDEVLPPQKRINVDPSPLQSLVSPTNEITSQKQDDFPSPPPETPLPLKEASLNQSQSMVTEKKNVSYQSEAEDCLNKLFKIKQVNLVSSKLKL